MEKEVEGNETSVPHGAIPPGNAPAAGGGDDATTSGNASACEPGCGCGTAAGNGGAGSGRLKIAACMAVIVAVSGILLYKTSSARLKGNCTQIPSIAALNSQAAGLDTVFLFVPGSDNAPPSGETGAALSAVGKTLLAKGIRTALYSLEAGSPDYPELAARVPVPGIAVLTKGRGFGVVSGPATETSLLQAYVASTGEGGCGPDCPTSGGASKPCP